MSGGGWGWWDFVARFWDRSGARFFGFFRSAWPALRWFGRSWGERQSGLNNAAFGRFSSAKTWLFAEIIIELPDRAAFQDIAEIVAQIKRPGPEKEHSLWCGNPRGLFVPVFTHLAPKLSQLCIGHRIACDHWLSGAFALGCDHAAEIVVVF